MMQHRSLHITHFPVISLLAAVCAAAVLCISLCAAPQTAFAESAAEKQAQAEEALANLNAMQATLDEASTAYIAALTEYQQAIDAQASTQKRIDEITEQIGDIQGRLGDRAREMYRNGSSSIVDLLLGSASFEEFTQNWDLLNRVNESDAALSSKARELRDEAEQQKQKYVEQAAVADKKAQEASAAFERAKVLVEQLQASYESLSAEARELYAQEQAAAQAAYAAQAVAYVDENGSYVDTGGVVNDDGTVTDIQTGAVYESATEYHAATGNAIVDRARSMIGSDYVWGGVGGGDGGFDCSGLVSYAITGSNTRIGTSYSIGDMYTRVSDPQAGDLYVTDGHIAVYTGEGTLVHAVDYGIGVAETDFWQKDGGFFVRVE